MTVIYSDFGDTDTKVLSKLWEGLNAKVLHIDYLSKISQDEIDKALEEEKETLLICGHGSPDGCFDPRFGKKFTISESNVHKIKAKKIIGIWCHASVFAERFKLKGFYSYMFISNSLEACFNGIYNANTCDITSSELKFCNLINEALKENLPLNRWKEKLDKNTDAANDVEVFNYSKTSYFK